MPSPSYNIATNCASCPNVLFEGQSAVYDELADAYFCDRACHAEWLTENVAEYQRKWLMEVDL